MALSKKRRIQIRVLWLFIAGAIGLWIQFEFFDSARIYEDTELKFEKVCFKSLEDDYDMEGDFDHYEIHTMDDREFDIPAPVTSCFKSNYVEDIPEGDTIEVGYVDQHRFMSTLRGDHTYSVKYMGEEYVDRQCAIDNGWEWRWWIYGGIGVLSIMFLSRYRAQAEDDEEKFRK